MNKVYIYRKVLSSLIIGFIIAFNIGIAVFFLIKYGVDNVKYASPWDVTYEGWTKSVSLVHVISDTVIWVFYVCIAVAIARLHPIMDRIRSSKITVPIIVSVFVTCGGAHLVEAISTFIPAYTYIGVFKAFTAVVGIFGALFVSHDLTIVRELVYSDRQRLKSLNSIK